MVTALQEEDRPQPWVSKGKGVPPTTRETRTSARAGASKNAEDKGKNPKLADGVRGRKQTKALPPPRGMKTSHPVPLGSTGKVLGQPHLPTVDVEELCKKTEEDAVACGRVVKKISNPNTRKNFSTTLTSNTTKGNNDDCAPQVPSEGPQSSHQPSTIPVLTGMILYHSFPIQCVLKLST